MDKCDEVLVSICCVTYNQARFVEQTIRCFLKQKTSFPFEIIIHDDASSDGTAEIIKEYEKNYPCLIRAVLEEENQYSQGVDIWYKCVFPYARGKYLAFCDGDDYWTDDNKLQRQVDYLESHPDCSCVFHPVDYIDNEKKLFTDHTEKKERDYYAEKIIVGGGLFCATASLCCRSKYAMIYPDFRKEADVADYPLQLQLASMGYFHYIPDIMAVYRCNVSGSWSSRMIDYNKKINHFNNEISWIKEYDKYTEKKYHSYILYRLIYYYLILYRDGYGDLKIVKTLLKEIKNKKLKIKAIMKLYYYMWQHSIINCNPRLYTWLGRFFNWSN